MKKRIVLSVISFLMLFFLFGCSDSSDNSDKEQISGQNSNEMPEEIDESIETEIYINRIQISSSVLQELETLYGPLRPGRYWYDSTSGLYGKEGEGASAFIQPGHDLGFLPADISAGNTGVFINGRELPETEVIYLESVLQVQRQEGYYWLDAQGNIGFAGNSAFGNIFLATADSSGDGGYVWRDWYTGAGGGGQGGCNYINIPGSDGLSAGFYSSGC